MILYAAFAVVCVFIVLACPVQAQTFDATHLREPVDLGVKWLVHAGDDPTYASPDFDDSHWTPFDPYSSITALFPRTKPDVIWYRLRVKVDPAQTGLALRESNISQAFEIYVNGESVIASGQVAPFKPNTQNARLLARIPDKLLAAGSLLIAMRVHLSTSEWTNGQDPGFYSTNLTIGQEETLKRDDWLGIVGENALSWIDHLLFIGLGPIALVLYVSQRSQSEYLWIFALGVQRIVEDLFHFVSTFQSIPIVWALPGNLVSIASPFLWTSMYFAFVHQRVGWRWRIILAFAGVMNFVNSLQGMFLSSSLSFQLFANLPFLVLLSVVIPIVLAVHWRRGNREAGILLIPVILFSLYLYAEVGFGAMFEFPAWRPMALRGLGFVDRFPAGPFVLSLNFISGILSTLSLAIIMLLRSTSMSRRQALLEGELAAAQEVQRIILPELKDSVPGFTVESIYQPAQQVGGDFFQVLPAGQGGLLFVMGDVAGKGLPAAMLVSVLVGAIRGVAEYTCDPSELLANLNDRLIGRTQGGFATALSAHIAADGLVTIANAGHLSPYLDGREVDLSGALPLGIEPQAHYASSHFHLIPGSRLAFYSDGVVEARNDKGELFGFERGKAISTQPAADIVEAAKNFGQEDDITVVAIARDAAVAHAA